MSTYRNKGAVSTQEQFAKVGQIISDWAILDNLTQMILSKLAYAPWWLTGALTDNLSFESRQLAFKHLLEIHTIQLANTVISQDLCDEVDQFRKALIANRALRNNLAHWVIHRVDDEKLLASRSVSRPAKDNRQDTIILTKQELDDHLRAIEKIIDQALDLFDILPTLPDPFQRK